MAGAEGVSAKVEAYLRAELGVITDGSHGAVVALSAHALPDASRELIRTEHERLLAPLVGVLEEAGVGEPGLRALLIHGMVESAARAIAPGREDHNETVIRALVGQVLHGLLGEVSSG